MSRRWENAQGYKNSEGRPDLIENNFSRSFVYVFLSMGKLLPCDSQFRRNLVYCVASEQNDTQSLYRITVVFLQIFLSLGIILVKY